MLANGRIVRLAITCLFLGAVGISQAQDGGSTAGAARTRYLGNVGILPTPKDVVVEDIINYHRHEIGRPKAGEAVGLDVRWSNESIPSNGEAILQVGMSTSLVHDRNQLRPLNLSVVIDKSGSMADDNKLIRVKQALSTMVDQLRPTDVMSIVVFDSEAQVLVPAQEVADREAIKSEIRSIEPGSATNLCGGLMLGYKEALRHFSKNATNRVILLTDGIANRGEIDPREIARESASYNDRGIDLATIGVGQDLNKDLLETLAKSGHGLFHFIADSQDIQKVFVKELQSQISPVAAEPKLEIEFGSGLRIEKVYGYEPRLANNRATISLDTMNSGMTEVVLVKFKPRGEEMDVPNTLVRVKLTYYDLDRKKTVVAQNEASIEIGSHRRKNGIEDASIAKNYAIAVLAQGMRDMAAAAENHQYRQAEAVLNRAIERTSAQFPNLDDEDIKRTMQIAQKYQSVLMARTREDDSDVADRDAPAIPTRGANLITNGDFSLGNSGFSSGLDYNSPADNCLWSGSYTIAPEFNHPRLHTLAEERVEPYRIRSGSQVFYANAGGDGPLVLWSSVVKCQPNTTYLISFQSNSLNTEREWIPDYEIRIGDDRSSPQPAGFMAYRMITMVWNSRNTTSATVSIVRLPHDHNTGIIGITDIRMAPMPR